MAQANETNITRKEFYLNGIYQSIVAAAFWLPIRALIEYVKDLSKITYSSGIDYWAYWFVGIAPLFASGVYLLYCYNGYKEACKTSKG